LVIEERRKQMEELFQKYTGESERNWIEQLLEKVQIVLQQGGSYVSPFLEPRKKKAAEDVLSYFTEIKYYLYGGYPGAQKVQLGLWPAAVASAAPDVTPGVFLIKGPLREYELGEREIKGALVDAGLFREDIGDFIWTGEGVQVLVVKERAPRVKELASVGMVKVQVEEKDVNELQVPHSSVKEISGTVASLRLDSIMSLGYGISRSKASSMIKSGSVLVNYRKEGSPSYKVNRGDSISMASQGNTLEVVDLRGESRKGRQRVDLKKIIN